MITVDPGHIGSDGVLRGSFDALVGPGEVTPRAGAWIVVGLPGDRTTRAYVLLSDPEHNALNLTLADADGSPRPEATPRAEGTP